MKTVTIENIIKTGITFLCYILSSANLKAQSIDSSVVSFSLHEVIQQAKESNTLIGVLRTEESAAQLDLRDGRISALPRILSSASYHHYSEITVYEGVLGDSRQLPKPPNAHAGAIAVEASFNLYAGGRHHSTVKELRHKSELAAISAKEQEAAIALQAVQHYLDMVRFYFQRRVIDDHQMKATERLKNINALYANGKATKSDVLRADVLLSNVYLNEIANENDYVISNQKLNTLLCLNSATRIIPTDTASLILIDTTEFESVLADQSASFNLSRIRKNIEIQENRIRLAQSLNHPTATVFGGYGFNYPNTFMFPPTAQTVAVGQVGLRLSYEISSLYHNRNKIKSARLRETSLRQQKDWVTENIQQEAKSLAVKYNEALHRIDVIKKSVTQAETNYHIQNTRYFNQLGLLTDLLEADHLYQESRFNYIQAKIAAMSLYYRLLFVVGKI